MSLKYFQIQASNKNRWNSTYKYRKNLHILNLNFNSTKGFFLSYLIVQLTFCALLRLIFIGFSHESILSSSTLGSLLIGIKFDLGIILINLTLVFGFISLFKLAAKYTKILVFVFSAIQFSFLVIDIELFRTWDSIFSIRALKYLNNPLEVIRNTMNSTLLYYSIGLAVLYRIFIRIYDRYLNDSMENVKKISLPFASIVLILLSIVSFLSLRGGFRQIPRNQSDAYFCKNKTYNIAAINSTWNFFNVVFQNQKIGLENPYSKMNDLLASQIIEQWYQRGEIFKQGIFKQSTSSPNIILITMEGVSAELMNENRHQSHLKFIQKLEDSSYSFKRAYAVGFRTEQGLAALLSGALATPFNNLTDDVNRLPEIPSIIQSMKSRNYSTSFIFGGDVEFANMRAYLHEIGIEQLIDINDFPRSNRIQKLGVPDEFLFERASKEILQKKEPFFVQIMTQSTHQPFDIPRAKIKGDPDRAYEESAAYLDSCIGHFIQNIRSGSLWKNTIVIITSDHSHNYPTSIDIATRARYHIPMIIYSPILKDEFKGVKDTQIFSQNDIPATLSYWLGWDEKNYLPYSKNHFSDSKKFCFSTFVNGYVFQIDTHRLEFDYIWRPIDTNNKEIVKLHSAPMAIMQTAVDEIRGVKKKARIDKEK